MVQMFIWNLKKAFALWSVYFRVSAFERFCYKGFLRNSSGTKICFRHREMSALEDVRFREVTLYLPVFALGAYLTIIREVEQLITVKHNVLK